MVDFAKILKAIDDKRTPEERVHWAEYKRLVKEHTYWESTCILRKPYMTGVGVERTKESEIKVKLYSRVNFHSLVVGDRILLEFEPTPSYYFGREFVTRWLTNSHGRTVAGMYIDVGREWLVPQEDMDRIVTEGTKKIEELGLLAKWELE